MKKILPFVAIIATGAFVGNMVNIGFSYGLHWQSLEPKAFMETFAIDFPLLLGSTAVTLLPAFISSLILVFLNKRNTLSRKLWGYSFLSLLATIIITASYHLPMNLKFIEQTFTADEATAQLSGWILFHWVRVGIAIVAGVFGIKALTKSVSNFN